MVGATELIAMAIGIRAMTKWKAESYSVVAHNADPYLELTQGRCSPSCSGAVRLRLLDYIKGVGQPLAYYANDLKRRGWEDAIIYLPHDGVAHNNILRQALYRALGGGRL
jgi:hypothetical protein